MVLRYLFYQEELKKMRRYSIKTGAVKVMDMQVDNYRVYIDHVNKRLYYFETGGKESDVIYSIDYNGRSLNEIQLSEDNLGAIAVFGDFLYQQKLNKAVLEEINISTDLVNRCISLPLPFGNLNDITIIEKSQHSKGMIFIIYLLVRNNPDINNESLLGIKEFAFKNFLTKFDSSVTIHGSYQPSWYYTYSYIRFEELEIN